MTEKNVAVSAKSQLTMRRCKRRLRVNELRRFSSAGYDLHDGSALNYFRWNSNALPRLRISKVSCGGKRPFGTVSINVGAMHDHVRNIIGHRLFKPNIFMYVKHANGPFKARSDW